MNGMFLADGAILLELETIGIVALVLEAIIISVFALRALERDLHPRRFDSHCVKTPYKKITPLRCLLKVYHIRSSLSTDFDTDLRFFLRIPQGNGKRAPPPYPLPKGGGAEDGEVKKRTPEGVLFLFNSSNT